MYVDASRVFGENKEVALNALIYILWFYFLYDNRIAYTLNSKRIIV